MPDKMICYDKTPNNEKKIFSQKRKKQTSHIKKQGSFIAFNYKTIIVIILCLFFLGLLFRFVADGGSVLDVIESMLWYFAWPIGAFLIGFIIKKILYL